MSVCFDHNEVNHQILVIQRLSKQRFMIHVSVVRVMTSEKNVELPQEHGIDHVTLQWHDGQ